jgi:hypothetical protein
MFTQMPIDIPHNVRECIYKLLLAEHNNYRE